MENRIYILNELREISPVVAGIGDHNPYKVPAGYFEGLAGQLLQRVGGNASSPVLPATNNPYQVPQGYFEGLADQLLKRVKGNETSSLPLQQAKNNPYEVPAGYFETLAGKLLQKVKDNETALSAALLQAKNNAYEVPADYFNHLPAVVFNRIKAEQAGNANDELEILSPLLSQIGKNTPFSTPAGYFGELTENAVAGAQAIDFVNGTLENLSPLMTSLKNQQVYEVPAGYFEQLPAQVLNVVKAQQPAKVVSMSFTRRIMYYAAAAVVAGIIAAAGWMYMSNDDKTTGSENAAVVAQTELDSISDEILEKYLENQTAAPAETATAVNYAGSAEIDANDMKDMLADVSDEDLQRYLEKYSITKDIITN